MWIFLIEIAGVILSLCGWFGLHNIWLLLAGSVMIAAFDVLMTSSGGQIKNHKLSVFLLIAGALAGILSGYGIAAALLAFSVYSACVLLLKLILLVLAVMNRE